MCGHKHENGRVILLLMSAVRTRLLVRELHLLLLLSIWATIHLSIAVAQAPQVTASATDPNVVTVMFFVDDNRGNPVSTLQLSDLSVLDNNKPPATRRFL